MTETITETTVPDPTIATFAADSRIAARRHLDWSLDHLRLDVGLAEVCEEDAPGGRMLLCHRPCAAYAHFHWVRDRD